MKLECPVVRDLYTLYMENELSGEVREAVDEHLEGCEECRHLYESESNFNDILKKDPDEQPSKKLDEKMMLRLKVSRLRIAVIFIAAIFLMTIYSNYSQSRRNLLYDLSPADQIAYSMYNKIDDIKNDGALISSLAEDMQALNNQQKSAVVRDLNPIEKYQMNKVSNELFMDFKVNDLYNILKTRHMKGTFTDRDEKATSLFKQYMEGIAKSMNNEMLNLEKGKLETLIRPIDIKSIAEDYYNLNQLALLYTQYDKLPGEISPMSEAAIKARLKSVLNIDDADIRIDSNMKENIRLNGNFTFDINKQGNLNYHGEMDAYTGSIQTLTSFAPDKTGDLVPYDGVKDNLLKFLQKMYGKEQSFDIQYEGINYQFSSNTDIKLYSFKVHPVINGLKVDSELYIYYNARSGELYSINEFSGRNYIVPNYTVDTAVKVSPAEGLKNLNIGDKEKYAYSETIIIKSLLTGKYVPVLVYKSESNSVYVNAITGKQEFVY